MEMLIIAALIGLIPAMIAQKKGRSFGLWWFYGAMLFIIALPHALLISADKKAVEAQQLSEGMKKCPFCAEMIKGEAKVCRYCGKELNDTEIKPTVTNKSETSTKQNIIHPKRSKFEYNPSHSDET